MMMQGSQSLKNFSETIPNTDSGIRELQSRHINSTSYAVQLNKNNAPRKLVSGSQFRATIREPVKCEQCESYERCIYKSKETIRSLKLQISRLEEMLQDRNLSRQSISSLEQVKEAANSAGLDEMKKENKLLQKKLSDFEKENCRQRQEYSDYCICAEMKNRKYFEEHMQLSKKLEDSSKIIDELNSKIRVLSESNRKIQENCNDLKSSNDLLKEQLQNIEIFCFPSGK